MGVFEKLNKYELIVRHNPSNLLKVADGSF
jgi:hypothetical protein